MPNKKIALILAGGRGTRLWPLSRQDYPKQFIKLKGNESLFQLTIKRVISCFKPWDVYIISSENYKFTILNQIEFFNKISKQIKFTLKNNFIFEPTPKNTVGAVLFSIKYLGEVKKIEDNYLIYVFPSDHIIEPLSKFKMSLVKGQKLAEKGLITVFGVSPRYPQEGYGYILSKGGYRVKKFVEKPILSKAKRLLKEGALWNTGIFCFRKDDFLQELSKYSPQIYKYYQFSFKSLIKNFSRIPSSSIDYAIIQKTKKAAFVKFNVRWLDLGSWDSFLEYCREGKENNIGKAEFLNCKDCFVYSQNKLISLIGLKDVIVVDGEDSLLVVKKDFSERVKELTEILIRKNFPQIKSGTTVYRPWGYYTILKEKENYKVKEIGIYPGKCISLQKHKYRSEHWNVVEAKAQVVLGNKRRIVNKNESLFVPKGKLHKVYNPTHKILKIIEVQIGSYLGEDDIKRYDRY